MSNCGLPDEIYLPPVSISTIQADMTTSVTIQLPSISDANFTNFKLFYRIYISKEDVTERITQDRTDLMNLINPTLQSNVNNIKTDPTNAGINTNTVRTYFRTYRFYELDIENASIETLLRTSGRLTLDFPGNNIPNADKGGSSYRLLRSTISEAVPAVYRRATDDWYLRNTPELNDNDFANTNDNGDVQSNTSVIGMPRYTYILIYIVSAGFDPSNLSIIYSIPTYVGIFKLPDINIGG